MKLHIGCGGSYRKGWLNADAFDTTVADKKLFAEHIDLPDGSCTVIAANHLIEHLGYFGAVRFFGEAFRLLEKGGMSDGLNTRYNFDVLGVPVIRVSELPRGKMATAVDKFVITYIGPALATKTETGFSSLAKARAAMKIPEAETSKNKRPLSKRNRRQDIKIPPYKFNPASKNRQCYFYKRVYNDFSLCLPHAGQRALVSLFRCVQTGKSALPSLRS